MIENKINKTDIFKTLMAVKELKIGGQKTVYTAIHPKWGECVLKIGKKQSPEALTRAKREVELQKSINSKYYPNVYEFKLYDDGFYIFEEYIRSVNLTEKLNENWPLDKVIDLIMHISLALKPLWDQGIAHRDIKPDNILIPSNGIPKIIDLGIMKDPNDTSLTIAVFPVGPCTPDYAAPEQLTNTKADISSRTDQFAIGIIMFQLCTGGVHPFDPKYLGANENVPQNILAGVFDKSKLLEFHIPNFIIEFIRRCLGFNPYERYRNFRIFNDALNKCMEECK